MATKPRRVNYLRRESSVPALTGLKRRQIKQSQPAAVMLASVKALIVANEFLEALVEGLRADVSKGYARAYYHGWFKTYRG